MTFLQTLIIAIIQGLTELFPISSVAHSVFTPYIFHWNLDQEFLKEHFLPFVVMMHLGTAAALLIFFHDDWIEMIQGLFNRQARKARLMLLMIIVGTIPAAVLGFLFEKPLTHLFSNVTTASFFLIINGLLLFFGEKARHRGRKEIVELTYGQAALIGLFQSLALIPGFSRSGASMTAGFWMGLKHEESARFSMLLATPIILGAGVLEVPKLIKEGGGGLFQTSMLGGILAGLFAYISVWILMHWFKKNEISAMRPFAYYCWIVGAAILLSSIF